MKLLAVVGAVVLAAGSMSGQTDKPAGEADDFKQMREMLMQQQKQLAEQQKQMTEQQKQIAEQQQQLVRERDEIEKLRTQMTTDATTTAATKASASPQLLNAALTTAPATAASAAPAAQSVERKESPLSFRVGGMDFTPGGFFEAENVFRTTNSGSVISTNFGTIPFSNTAQGQLTESRLTAQFSRLNLKVTGRFLNTDITGYAEVDFNGNDAGNVFTTANSHTLRDRLFFADLRRNKWEILGGQTWSFLVPNRQGVSPMPSDLAITLDEDGNVQVGIPYTRAAEVRFIYHPNDHLAAGIALENPEQISGDGAGEVVFPAAFATQLTNQFDPNNAANSTPNVAPDLIPKIAYDTTMGGRHLHLEGVGLVTSVKVATQPAAGMPFSTSSQTGVSGGAALNVELLHNFRFLANGLYGAGGGHYNIQLGPSAVVTPTGEVSLVHTGGGLAGFEYQPTAKTQLGAYYGVAYFERNAFLDTSAGAKPNTIIGFGGIGSPNTNNKSLQQPTFDWRQTFWQNPQFGAVQLITQTSYLTRSPWFVAPGAPKDAHLVMVYTSLRYVIP